MTVRPVVRVDTASDVPVYRQIVTGVRTLLVAGAFPVGSTLPTVRQLALDLNVHHNTVAEAYRLLADEGWLELHRRRGAVVRDRSQPRPAPRARATLVQRLREVAAEAHAGGLGTDAIAGAIATVAADLAAGRIVKPSER